MKSAKILLTCVASSMVALPVAASTEGREQYLERLQKICDVGCQQPRDFQRTARKRPSSDNSDMAIIMDVATVRRSGSNFELLSFDLERSALEDLDILESAGINTSSRNGIGGLPRGSQGGGHPNLIVIEMDEQTLFDILNIPSQSAEGSIESADADGIVVDGDRERVFVKPTLGEVRSLLRNRRVVVRGKPRLEPVLIGARRDFRRKQVTLELDSADELVLLPRYDDYGEPILEGELAGLQETTGV